MSFKNRPIYQLTPLFFFILLFFTFYRDAFLIYFFKDDFAFLSKTKIQSLMEFFNFFNPIKETFFRPLPTEVFYFLMHSTDYNTYLFHFIVLLVFLAGVWFLYKSVEHVTNTYAAFFTAIFYTFHISHVYQLYWFATFQEVSLFFFMAAAFYMLLRGKNVISLGLLFGALLSKEQALLYPFLAGGFLAVWNRNFLQENIKYLVVAISMVGVFGVIYAQGIQSVETLPQYRIHFDPHIVRMNIQWYSMWTLGLPSVMSTLFPQLLQPLPEFWQLFSDVRFRMYILGLIGFFVLIIGAAIYVAYTYILKGDKKRQKIAITGAVLGGLYIVSLSPSLFISHIWMVRLTIPLVFYAFAVGWITSKLYTRSYILKGYVVLMLSIYMWTHYFGVQMHEVFSTYELESKITHNAYDVFEKYKITHEDTLFFDDDDFVTNVHWNGSSKLKTTFSDQDFLDFYFPNIKGLKARYDFEEDTVPDDAIIIQSSEMFTFDLE